MAELPLLGENHRDWSDEEESDKDERKDRKKQRVNTTMVIDQGNPPVRNIIIPLPQLILFLTNNFVCQNCKLVSAKPDIEIDTFGFVTWINYRCDCDSHSSLRPDLLLSSKEKVEKLLKPGKAISS
jgi:hypothetical protein